MGVGLAAIGGRRTQARHAGPGEDEAAAGASSSAGVPAFARWANGSVGEHSSTPAAASPGRRPCLFWSASYSCDCCVSCSTARMPISESATTTMRSARSSFGRFSAWVARSSRSSASASPLAAMGSSVTRSAGQCGRICWRSQSSAALCCGGVQSRGSRAVTTSRTGSPPACAGGWRRPARPVRRSRRGTASARAGFRPSTPARDGAAPACREDP